jgi:kanamycin kinase
VIGPQQAAELPASVAGLSAGRCVRLAWRNEVGGLTFEIGAGADRRFLKWVPAGAPLDLAAEGRRMAWACLHVAVPRPLAQGADDAGSWLLTTPVPGSNAAEPRWIGEAVIPPPDRLVVCHGDACAPNTLIGADGRWSAHVDLGALGVADRWADLAVATWSARWNYGPDWEQPLLDAYGVAADPERTAYYRLLYDLGP